MPKNDPVNYTPATQDANPPATAPFHYVVREPFSRKGKKYRKGDRITDPQEIEDVKDRHNYCIRVPGA